VDPVDDGGRVDVVDAPCARSTRSTRSTGSTRAALPSSPEAEANGALVLLRVVRPLLGRQLAAQADAFENQGGFRERLYRVRTARRRGQGGWRGR
jgi:four helix bundle suffix protein